MFTTEGKVEQNAEGEVGSVSIVSMPTFTVYKHGRGLENGIAIIVCLAGDFRNLSFKGERIDIVNWLVFSGVIAFMLKYRLVPETRGTFKDLIQNLMKSKYARIDSVNGPYVPMAFSDGREAIKYVRSHTSDYGIDPLRIGIMGFSAGGTVSSAVAHTYDKECRSDFIAAI